MEGSYLDTTKTRHLTNKGPTPKEHLEDGYLYASPRKTSKYPEEARSVERNLDFQNNEAERHKVGQKQEECVDPTNVFVKFLPPDCYDEELRQLFSPFGKIVSAKVMLNHTTRSSLGYGYAKKTQKKTKKKKKKKKKQTKRKEEKQRKAKILTKTYSVKQM
jgi:hypothetical protein